jgi:hypothetical protein
VRIIDYTEVFERNDALITNITITNEMRFVSTGKGEDTHIGHTTTIEAFYTIIIDSRSTIVGLSGIALIKALKCLMACLADGIGHYITPNECIDNVIRDKINVNQNMA